MTTSATTHGPETPGDVPQTVAPGNCAGGAPSSSLGTPSAPSSTEDSLKRLYAKGLTDAEIARELGMSRFTIYRKRRELGLRSFTEAEHRAAETKAAHAEGLTNRQMAERFGVSPSTISARVRQLGLKPNPDPQAVRDERHRAREQRKSEARRQRKALERARLMRAAFAHSECPVPEAMLGAVMAKIVRGEVRAS